MKKLTNNKSKNCREIWQPKTEVVVFLFVLSHFIHFGKTFVFLLFFQIRSLLRCCFLGFLLFCFDLVFGFISPFAHTILRPIRDVRRAKQQQTKRSVYTIPQRGNWEKRTNELLNMYQTIYVIWQVQECQEDANERTTETTNRAKGNGKKLWFSSSCTFVREKFFSSDFMHFVSQFSTDLWQKIITSVFICHLCTLSQYFSPYFSVNF